MILVNRKKIRVRWCFTIHWCRIWLISLLVTILSSGNKKFPIQDQKIKKKIRRFIWLGLVIEALRKSGFGHGIEVWNAMGLGWFHRKCDGARIVIVRRGSIGTTMEFVLDLKL